MASGTAVRGETALGSAARNGTGPQDVRENVTFPDLVRAHRAWEVELYGCARDARQPDTKLEEAFTQKLAGFEGRYGEIKNAYWSVRDASAVALTVDKRRRRLAVWRYESIPRFHRVTDWATRDEPAIAGALDDCESLAVRVEEILRGPGELIALRRVNAVASQLLGYVDRQWGREEPPVAAGIKPPDWVHQAQCKEFVHEQRQELEEVEAFYTRAGYGQAKILFFWGMVVGIFVLALVTALVVGTTWPVDSLDGGPTHWGDLQLFVISVLAGALGALLSVLQRMASTDVTKFTLDFEVGRSNVRWLGIYRPFVGGIFGAATFLLLGSGILQTEAPGADKDYAYYGILAFFSGFFERFTKLPTGDMPSAGETGAAAKADTAENAAGAGQAQGGA